MRNLVAGNDHPDLLALEGLGLGRRDAMGHCEQVRRQFGISVDPVIDFGDRYDQCVACGHRVDRHERDAAVVAMNERARNVAVDDHGEDAAHTFASVCAAYDLNVTSAEQPAAPTGEGSLFDNLWTIPNLFTLVRLLCLPVFLWLLFSRDNRAGAAWMLAVLGSTDWVDGYIARRFNQVSEFGKIFDPTVDRLFFFVSVVAIIIDDSIPLWFGVAVLFRELAVGAMMTIATLFFGMERFDVTWWGKTATFLLMGAVPSFLLGNADVFESDVFGVLAWLLGIPGLALSYWTGIGYIPAVRAGVAAGRTDRTDQVPTQP